MIPLTIAVIEILRHKGRETVEIDYPQIKKKQLEGIVTAFFHYKNIKYEVNDDRITGIDGFKWLLGEWVYDILIKEHDEGCLLVGEFYHRIFWPFPEMKFSKFGYYNIVGRHHGWRERNELFYYIDRHRELNGSSDRSEIDFEDRQKNVFSGEYSHDISTPGKEIDGFRGVKVEGVSTDDKQIVLSKYMEVLDIDLIRAENLYNSGYKSAEDFNDVLPEDLMMIERINPTIARRIVRNIERLNK